MKRIDSTGLQRSPLLGQIMSEEEDVAAAVEDMLEESYGNDATRTGHQRSLWVARVGADWLVSP